MMQAYADVRSLNPGDLEPALNAIELWMLFVLWPSFLPYGNPDNKRMMTSRLRHLPSARAGGGESASPAVLLFSLEIIVWQQSPLNGGIGCALY